MSKIFGYKTADGPDFFTTYTIHGFVIADSLEEAAAHFGVESPNGYDVVAELTEDQFLREYKDHTVGWKAKDYESALSIIERHEHVLTDLRTIAEDLGYTPGLDI